MLIQAFWQLVHPHVGEESYVMDFAYLLRTPVVTVCSTALQCLHLSLLMQCRLPLGISYKGLRTYDRERQNHAH